MEKNDADFSRLNSLMLVATFFALWLAVYFEYAVEDVLAYVLILSFGILHGANDIKLIQTASSTGRRLRILKVLAYYVGFVLSVAALFYLVPSVALAIFVLFSAYHFGEQHWVSKMGNSSVLDYVFYTLYGLFIFFLLFSAHSGEVTAIIRDITGRKIDTDYYRYGLGIAAIFMFPYMVLKLKQKWSSVLLELFYLLVFFIVFQTASLLWAFAIYFIIWHSIPSLTDQVEYLYGGQKKIHFLKYLKSSLLYWLVSVVALVVLFAFVGGESRSFLPLLFSFLAAITFPHVFVISRLNRN